MRYIYAKHIRADRSPLCLSYSQASMASSANKHNRADSPLPPLLPNPPFPSCLAPPSPASGGGVRAGEAVGGNGSGQLSAFDLH